MRPFDYEQHSKQVKSEYSKGVIGRSSKKVKQCNNNDKKINNNLQKHYTDTTNLNMTKGESVFLGGLDNTMGERKRRKTQHT